MEPTSTTAEARSAKATTQDLVSLSLGNDAIRHGFLNSCLMSRLLGFRHLGKGRAACCGVGYALFAKTPARVGLSGPVRQAREGSEPPW